MEIVLITPKPTRAYDEPEALGPFSDGFAQDYIDNHIEIGDDYEATVVVVKNPDEED